MTKKLSRKEYGSTLIILLLVVTDGLLSRKKWRRFSKSTGRMPLKRKKKGKKRKECRIPLVVSYHPDLPPLGRIINKHWPTLQSKKRLKKVFKNRPIVSYKRPRNLRDMLVKATFNYEENLWNNTIGCSPCQRCS